MCMTNRQYDNRMKKLADLEAQKKELEEKIKALQDEIKEDMGELETVETDNFIIRWTKSVINRFDTTKFKKEQEDLYTQYLTSSESRRFSFKAIA